MEEKNMHRGGARKGAGRPKGTSRLYAFRADKEVADFIDRQANKTEFIRDCVTKVMDAHQQAVQQTSQQMGQQTGLQAEHQTGEQTGHQTVQQAVQQTGRDEGMPDFGMPGFGVVTPASRVRPLSLPFFDVKLVAGFPIPLDNDELAQDIELLKMLCPHPEASYLIRVTGNSMIESGINDGDILIVDKSNRQPSERQAAVCELNGEYTVKRVVEDAEGLWLVPSNPDYPRIEVREGDRFSVWGVVTYVIHKPIF